MSIFLKKNKSFIEYLTVILLRQWVDSLKLFTVKEKLKAMAQLKFSNTLKKLKTYLKMTDYLRNYILWYAVIAQPLQNKKTLLLKLSSLTDNAKKVYFKETFVEDLLSKETWSFETIQKMLSLPYNLHHFDHIRDLWINSDAFKKEMRVMIFHIKEDLELTTSFIEKSEHAFNNRKIKKYSSFSQIESILFLSHLLSPAKTYY